MAGGEISEGHTPKADTPSAQDFLSLALLGSKT